MDVDFSSFWGSFRYLNEKSKCLNIDNGMSSASIIPASFLRYCKLTKEINSGRHLDSYQVYPGVFWVISIHLNLDNQNISAFYASFIDKMHDLLDLQVLEIAKKKKLKFL